MKKDNILLEKTYAFALQVIRLQQYLVDEHQEYGLSKQILKSGTSIGANSEEAVGAQSRQDFQSKLSIAYKEARETHYWLRLLHDSDFLDKKLFESLRKDCDELLKIIGSTIKTLKKPNS